MKKTMVQWSIYNFSLLGLFLLGQAYDIYGLYTLSIIGYWFMSLISLCLLVPDVQEGAAKKIIETNQKVSPKWLNIIFDTGITLMLAFYGYPVLAFFWALHMAAYISFYNAMVKAKKEAKENS